MSKENRSLNSDNMVNIEEIARLISASPSLRQQRKSYLASRFNCTEDDIVVARKFIRTGKIQYNKGKFPKILIFDEETAPLRAYVWGRWKQNISLDETISEWFMLCWSAKWLYSNEIISDKLTSEEALNENDSRIVKHLWELIDEADIVIAYNGKNADVKWMNTRFIINGIDPPSSYEVIDPCLEARKVFRFSSNKLDALAGYFGIEHKMETGFTLWDKAVRGDQESIDYMSKYCGKDVKILEDVYLKMRPWIKGHPNINAYTDDNKSVCPLCGSDNIKEIKGKFYYTSVGKYKTYRCDNCGSISRGRVNLVKKGTIMIAPIKH